MRIRRRFSDIYNHITLADRYSVLRRYGLLENAVINYSGGITSLERRVRKSLMRGEALEKELRSLFSKPAMCSREEEVLRFSSDVISELSLLLKDIHIYLRDVRKCLPRGEDTE